MAQDILKRVPHLLPKHIDLKKWGCPWNISTVTWKRRGSGWDNNIVLCWVTGWGTGYKATHRCSGCRRGINDLDRRARYNATHRCSGCRTGINNVERRAGRSTTAAHRALHFRYFAFLQTLHRSSNTMIVAGLVGYLSVLAARWRNHLLVDNKVFKTKRTLVRFPSKEKPVTSRCHFQKKKGEKSGQTCVTEGTVWATSCIAQINSQCTALGNILVSRKPFHLLCLLLSSLRRRCIFVLKLCSGNKRWGQQTEFCNHPAEKKGLPPEHLF